MLARPEIGSHAHILLWLASQPADREYEWTNPWKCACGQYSLEHYGLACAWFTLKGHPINDLNGIALVTHPRTFGALYERAKKVWHLD